MKILLVYPGQVTSTYDVALGYHEILGSMGHEVIPYELHIWMDYHEGALRYWQHANPDYSFDKDQTSHIWQRLASEYLIVSVVKHQPDVILIVHGLLLHPEIYELLDKLEVPKAIILTECPYIDDEQRRMIEATRFDRIFVNDRASLEAIAGHVSYLPHSYSRIRHRPGRPDPAYASDVYFHGTWYRERDALFSNLNFNGRTARIVGVGWEDGVGDTKIGTPNSELVKHYQSTRIALNHHRTTAKVNGGEISCGQSIGPRAYEIAACGAFQLCDDSRPELAEVFGDSVATYADADELQAAIDYYLSHDDERRQMAREAMERVTRCSFYDRAVEIVLPTLEAL